MNDTETPNPASMARDAVLAVRALASLTAHGDAYREPRDVAVIHEAVFEVLITLPTILDRAQQWLEMEAEAGRIYDDRHDALRERLVEGLLTVDEIAIDIDHILKHAQRAASAAGAAMQRAMHLGGHRE